MCVIAQRESKKVAIIWLKEMFQTPFRRGEYQTTPTDGSEPPMISVVRFSNDE